MRPWWTIWQFDEIGLGEMLRKHSRIHRHLAISPASNWPNLQRNSSHVRPKHVFCKQRCGWKPLWIHSFLSHLQNVKTSSLYCCGEFVRVKSVHEQVQTLNLAGPLFQKQTNERRLSSSPSARLDVWMHYCCVCGFTSLWADSIALVNICCGSTSVSCGLHVCSWDCCTFIFGHFQ